jgi:hypothetical protein
MTGEVHNPAFFIITTNNQTSPDKVFSISRKVGLVKALLFWPIIYILFEFTQLPLYSPMLGFIRR